jgi:tRNA nucleotidyltransferase (CCA-adding enzyme)
LIAAAPDQLEPWVGGLALEARERDGVLRAARAAPEIVRTLREREHVPSELLGLLGGEPPETLALALALGAPPEPILRWVTDLSGVRLEIGGDDLLAAGVPEGPAIGRALEETLRRKLDGILCGREQELQAALELAQ